MTATAVTRNPSEMGWVTKTEKSPWLIVKARLSCCSANGPRISPMMQGATGMSK
jgi:hypothetical protein